MLARVFDVFPVGTVFVAVIDPGVGGRRRNLIAAAADRYVVGPDNGLLTDIDIAGGVDEAYSIRQTAARPAPSFRRESTTTRSMPESSSQRSADSMF